MFKTGENVKTYGYLVGVEMDDTVDPEKIKDKLLEGIWHKEGIGKADITLLGEVEIVDEGSVDESTG